MCIARIMDQLPSVAANVHVPIFWFCPGKTPTIRSFSHKQATGQEMRVRLCFSPVPDVEVAWIRRCWKEIIWICPEAIERGANCNKKYKAKCKYNSINIMHSKQRRHDLQCVHLGGRGGEGWLWKMWWWESRSKRGGWLVDRWRLQGSPLSPVTKN